MHFFSLKQIGHPVSPKDNCFFAQEKIYPKEACDVRSYYSTLLPLSSNQNYQSNGFSRCQRIAYPGPTQQTASARVSRLRSKSLHCPQLGRTYRTRSEHGQRPGMDQMPLPQAVLPALPRRAYRESGAFSLVPASHRQNGTLRVSIVSHDDRLRGGAAPGLELENGQGHRQTLSGTRLRATGFKRIAYFSRRRDLYAQRASLPDRGTGLSVRPRNLCR